MKKIKILIADDSELVRDYVQSLLESNNFEVETAEDGVEAILKTYEVNPDLIILDVEMPIMKGYQVSRYLKSKPDTSCIPIIIHTTREEKIDKFWGYSTGADAYVTKDFDNSDTLLEAVMSNINKYSSTEHSSIESLGKLISNEDVMSQVNDSLDRELFTTTIIANLSEISRNITSPPETVVRVFSLIKKFINFDIGCLYIDRKTEGLLITNEETINNELYKSFVKETKPYLKKYINNISKKKIKVDRIKKGKETDESGLSIKSIWERPIKNLNVQSGIIFLASTRKNAFNEESVEILERIYQQAAVLIQNAILYHDITMLEEKTLKVFEKYVPRDVINDFLKSDTDSLLSGDRKKVAILFSDIRSFTTLSEDMQPERVVNFLNSYFSKMVYEITQNKGTIDKFIGDAILAIFGAPKQLANNSYSGIKSALAMLGKLDELNEENKSKNFPPMRIGIGAHFGEAIVGNIGSTRKMDYTVIGDSVNLASRLEGLTKYYRINLIVTKELVDSLEDHKDEFYIFEIDTVMVKGKHEPTTIYTAYDKTTVTAELEKDVEAFKHAYGFYRKGEFSEAIDLFKNIDDNFTLREIYIERCENFITHPPEEWEGVFKMDTK